MICGLREARVARCESHFLARLLGPDFGDRAFDEFLVGAYREACAVLFRKTVAPTSLEVLNNPHAKVHRETMKFFILMAIVMDPFWRHQKCVGEDEETLTAIEWLGFEFLAILLHAQLPRHFANDQERSELTDPRVFVQQCTGAYWLGWRVSPRAYSALGPIGLRI